jgi:hypothetical protein
MQVVDKYGNTFGQGHLVITTKSGKSKLPVVTVAWGNITGVLANQTDLQDALDLKVPTSRTLTINGVTQDLSADRTWTISTGITVNTTPITGGTSGRLLFDDAGVVGETNGVHWDKINQRLGINTAVPTYSIQNHFAYTGVATTRVGLYISDQNVALSGSSTFIAFGRFEDGGTFSGLTTGIRNIFLGNNGFEQGLAFHTASGGVGALNSPSSSEVMRLTNTKNLLVGTTTDAGYKLDVNGTTRLQRTLDLGSVGYAGTINLRRAGDGGITSQITQTDNVTVIHNYQGSGTEFKVDNVTYFHVRGFANQYAARVMGNLTAVSGLSTALLVNNTISASANNDVLIGLDVAPTFNNGAFTGVQNYAARFGGNIVFQPGATRTISVLNPTSSGSGNHLVIQSGSATTSGNGGDIYLNVGGGAGGPGPGRIYIGNNNGWDVAYVRGLLTVNNSGPNTGVGFQVNSGGQTGLSIYWDNLTPFMQYGLVSGRQSRFVNSSSYTFSSKVFINTTVDAGFNFDVNGTARIVNRFQAQGGISFTSLTPQTGNGGLIYPAGNGMILQGYGASSGNDRYGRIYVGNVTATSNFLGYFVGTTIGTNNTVFGATSDGINSTTYFYFGSNLSNIVSSAIVNIDSTTKGFLPPRMTNTEMLAIATPAEGLVVYDLTNRKLCCYDGATWQNLF